MLRFYWVSWVAKEQKKLMALEPVWARFRVSLVSKLQKSERKKKWPLRFDSPHVDFFAITITIIRPQKVPKRRGTACISKFSPPAEKKEPCDNGKKEAPSSYFNDLTECRPRQHTAETLDFNLPPPRKGMHSCTLTYHRIVIIVLGDRIISVMRGMPPFSLLYPGGIL